MREAVRFGTAFYISLAKNAAQITSAATLSSCRRPGSPPPELLAEKHKSNLYTCK
jgi:hypothetical protein